MSGLVGGLESLVNFENDSLWFMRNYDKLKDEFKGKVIIVRDRKVIMDAADMEKLREKAEKEKIELSECVVEFIPIEEMTLII